MSARWQKRVWKSLVTAMKITQTVNPVFRSFSVPLFWKCQQGGNTKCVTWFSPACLHTGCICIRYQLTASQMGNLFLTGPPPHRDVNPVHPPLWEEGGGGGIDSFRLAGLKPACFCVLAFLREAFWDICRSPLSCGLPSHTAWCSCLLLYD